VQILMQPLTPQYYQEILDKQEQFKAGLMPAKFSAKEIGNAFAKIVADVSIELAGFFSVLMGGAEPSYNTNGMRPFEEMSEQTKKKARGRHFKSEIRICAEGERKETTVKSLYLAFRDMDNDNKLMPIPVEYKHIVDREFSSKSNMDVFSIAELEKLIQLPTKKLQRSMPVERIGVRENPLPKQFFDEKGIPFAHYQYRGQKQVIHLPTNRDELCRLGVNIGPTGSGKSEKAANYAVEAIKAGESVFVLDPAQGTLCDNVRDALPKDFPENHIIDFDYGNFDWPVEIHWQSINTNNKAMANQMTNNLIAYLNRVSSDEMGDRTKELLRCAAKVIFSQGLTLLELKLMYRSKEYCMELLKNVTDLRIVTQWEDYWSLSSEAMRRQYSDPVLSRINALVGDDFIGNCILQKPKDTNIFRWLNGDLVDGKRIPYCVLLRMPKSKMGEEGLNAVATYFIYAIWLAVLNRNPMYTPVSWLILDEPHQYLGSAIGGQRSIWGQMASEMRKWGLGVQMYFHSWEQIPNDVRKIMKDTGVNYSLFQTDKDTFKDLEQEFAPFDVEDFLELERFSCINRILCGGQWHVFISKCLEPAIDYKNRKSWRCEYIDRSKLTDKCHRRYGRNIEEVEKDLYERESILYNKKKKKTVSSETA
jgi:hypothetical protein